MNRHIKSVKFNTSVIGSLLSLVLKRFYRTENTLFRLHYPYGVVIFGLLEVICFACVRRPNSQLLSCMLGSEQSDLSDGDYNSANDGCFAVNAYSTEPEEAMSSTKLMSIQPGVEGLFRVEDNTIKRIQYHKYYELTLFLFLIQAIMLTAPKFLWSMIEGGKIKMFVKHTLFRNFETDKDDKEDDSSEDYTDKEVAERRTKLLESRKNIAEYFVAGLGYNTFYGFGHVFCELLNLTIVFMQIYFLDKISQSAFSFYGLAVLRSVYQNHGDDPFTVFPTLAKCTLNLHGPGGNIVPHSGICTLTVNVFNRMYFVFVWLYLMFLGIAGVINFIHRIATILSPTLRNKKIQELAITTPKRDIKMVVAKCGYGDWFFLTLIGSNFSVVGFNCIFKEIVAQMQEMKENV